MEGETAREVSSFVASWKEISSSAKKSFKIIVSQISLDEKTPNEFDEKMSNEYFALYKCSSQFFKNHNEILSNPQLLTLDQLEYYYDYILSVFYSKILFKNMYQKLLKTILEATEPISYEIIKEFDNSMPVIANLFEEINLKAEQIRKIASRQIVIKLEPFDVVESVKNQFSQYLEIARHGNLEDEDFKVLNEEIMKVTEIFYKTGFKSSVHSFSSIVGPSLMGKTQFAFMLARLHPVFYVNFSGETLEQEVYRAFRNISRNLISLLKDDSSSLFKEGMSDKEKLIQLDSDGLATSGNIKLKTIGFLWELVKYSLDFDFTNGADWFIYYLEARDIVFEPMSINEYYTEMGKAFITMIFVMHANFTLIL